MELEHWRDHDSDNQPYSDARKRQLAEVVSELDEFLPDVPVSGDVVREFEDGVWSLGSVWEVLAPRPILRGFIVPIREVPVVVPVTLKVFAFLTIEGSDKLLDRHTFHGIHYHYLLANKTHTTTMICWDTRWTQPPLRRGQPDAIRPIFHEIHGKGSKHAKARPDLWRDQKRKSIWNACSPDLEPRYIGELRCASNKALPLWPVGQVLTPHPLALAAKSHSKSAKSRK